jgi:hypothetical protein
MIPASHPGLDCDGTCTAALNFPKGLNCSVALATDANPVCAGTFTLAAGDDNVPGLCGLLKDPDVIADCEKLAYCGLPYYNGINNSSGAPACSKTFTVERAWEPVGPNFDHVGNALLTVFEVSSGEMWPDIMYTVVDAVVIDGQADLPRHKEFNTAVALYFIFVTIVCAFLLLNLFVGVVVDNFDKMKKEGVSLVTDEQQLWINSQQMALECAPIRKPEPPAQPLRKMAYDLVESKRFELTIMACIMLNVITMAMRVYDAPEWYSDMLEVLNRVFIAIFIIEAALKIFGLGLREYFARGWCRFDFTLVFLSIVLMKEVGLVGGGLQQYATLARVLRVARMFRLMQTNKQLLTMFKTLVTSLPSIVNVATVLLLVFFIFACLGMNVFAFVKEQEMINAHANFNGFFNSLYLLFRMSTGESYNGLMHDAMISGADCMEARQCTVASCGCKYEVPSNCGSLVGAPIYFLFFFILSSLLLWNLFVAIILDNFGATQTFENAVVQHEHLDGFSSAWCELDPTASGFIPSDKLKFLLMQLPRPLGVKGTCTTKDAEGQHATGIIKRMDVPDRGGCVSFNEVLSALSSLATPTVLLPDDLLHSEMMQDLIVKKNNIPSIRRNNTVMKKHHPAMFQLRGRLYTMEERHMAEKIQARIRGVMHRVRRNLQAAKALSSRDLAVDQKQAANL